MQKRTSILDNMRMLAKHFRWMLGRWRTGRGTIEPELDNQLRWEDDGGKIYEQVDPGVTSNSESACNS